jgi:pimeloyl-ACP methyl ester carboxylesterase
LFVFYFSDFIKLAFETKYVYIPSKQLRLWTLTVNKELTNVPVVMVHGMGGGVGLWSKNIDELASNRPLFAFDLLGFGRSSRPTFSNKPELAEEEFVESLEEWRKQMKLDKFVLLGHSLGAYISSSYAIKYPERVKHLVLADPWGFPDKPPDNEIKIPSWIRVIGAIIKPFNPLAVLRAAGPWG